MSSPFDAIDVAAESSGPRSVSGREPDFLGRAASVGRVRIAFAFLAVGIGVLAVRAIDVQVRQGSRYSAFAAQNRLRQEIIVPERGTITDRNGTSLVENVQRYVLGVVPALLPRDATRTAAIAAIATLLERAPEELAATIASFPPHLTEPIPVRTGLAYDAAIARYAQGAALPALRLTVENERVLTVTADPTGSLAHVLGYLGRMDAEAYATLRDQRYRPTDRTGKTGVERSYEAMLRGTPGLRTTTVDARGSADHTSAIEPARAGATLALTIDAPLQRAAARALFDGARGAGSRRGAAVVLDAETGAVLALVSIPTYDATAMSRGLTSAEATAIFEDTDQPLFPRATAGTYPSGSTIKPIVAAAALEADVIGPLTRLHSTGGLRIAQAWFPDWKAGGHGTVTVRQAIAESVNTFFYLIGGGKPRTGYETLAAPTQDNALGPERIASALRAFGLGEQTGIDLPSEGVGLIPDPAWKQRELGEEWYIGDTYHLAIGQGDVLVTPLQLAVATAAIANDGTRPVPYLNLDTPHEQRGGSVSISPDVLAIVRRGMRDAVTSGSAAGLSGLPFQVFGKTGTAEHGLGTTPHAWFIGFAEQTNDACQRTSTAPGTILPDCVALAVLVEEGGEGSRTAVPIARAILQAWYSPSR